MLREIVLFAIVSAFCCPLLSQAPIAVGQQVSSPQAGAPPVAGATAKSAKLEAVIDRVQKAYSGAETLSANFSQTSTLPSMGRTRTDTGTIELKRGGKLRWDFLKPEVRQFISDGKTLWVYSPADKQVVVTTLQEGASRTALNFLFGLGDIRKDFTPSLAEDQKYQRPHTSALILVPKEAIGTIKQLIVIVSDEDGMVREAEVQDHMGSITQVVFSELKVNAPVNDARFFFQKPDGILEIKPDGY